ncbi:hypothetical protein NR798_04510 [Archangium gephyra]|uniref:hypothetical protein n=1 Tax=Archangium gephyra TaxID=48 RepID=UPI0035D4A879
MADFTPPSWRDVGQFHFGWSAEAPAEAGAAALPDRVVKKLGGALGRARQNIATRALNDFNQEKQAARPADDDPSLAEFEAEWRFLARQKQQTLERAPSNTALHYKTGWLRDDSPLFGRIQDYLRENVRQKPCEAPRAEATRVHRARDEKRKLDAELQQLQQNGDPENKAPLLELRSRAMERVINEGASMFSSRRTEPPRSGPFRVTRIKVILHDTLWRSYRERREEIRGELNANADLRADLGEALRKISWTYRNAQLPVIDNGSGEVYLLHGTTEFVARMIASGNFRPDYGAKKAESSYSDPKFGALGQGTYFSDSFAKVMTYTSCPRCSDHRCACGVDRSVILSRVVLGRPTLARTHDSQRGNDVETLKQYRHSVYGLGFKFGHLTVFGSNEFLIKDARQAYPELVVYWQWTDNW